MPNRCGLVLVGVFHPLVRGTAQVLVAVVVDRDRSLGVMRGRVVVRVVVGVSVRVTVLELTVTMHMLVGVGMGVCVAMGGILLGGHGDLVSCGLEGAWLILVTSRDISSSASGLDSH